MTRVNQWVLLWTTPAAKTRCKWPWRRRWTGLRKAIGRSRRSTTLCGGRTVIFTRRLERTRCSPSGWSVLRWRAGVRGWPRTWSGGRSFSPAVLGSGRSRRRRRAVSAWRPLPLLVCSRQAASGLTSRTLKANSSTTRYADFEYEGRKIFEGIGSSEADTEGNPDTEITFMKKKFFQSALKHILWTCCCFLYIDLWMKWIDRELETFPDSYVESGCCSQ